MATQVTTKPAVPLVTSFPFNPLTTTFTRPADCDGIFTSSFLSGIDFSGSCLPKGFHTDDTSYFSPGLVCPTGYYSACHDNLGAKSITTVTCCPTYATDVSLSCVTDSTLAGIFSTLFCTWTVPGGGSTSLPVTVSDNGITSTEQRGFTGRQGLNAFGVRMVYQKTDTQTTTMATTTLATTTTMATTAVATTTRSRSTTATTETSPDGPGKTGGSHPGGSSSGLSTGAKAAIGVVVPLAVLGLLAGLFIWWRKRQQYNKVIQSVPPTELQGQESPPPSELPSEREMASKPPYLMPAVPVQELPAAELPAQLN
ncbi:transmembrane alpha-helix domain-containing [Trichoderma cornu-damae]|uniref:Transmembrane alpha-helix domain-containing n=1 Tax=Trichoderma cornu-damae TaxID=654480 RepID=A0A9P8QQZ5_9HYPO|nr:transmembrane alpha-helix domain-containing [Trichoderma cornu-damae]